MQKILLVEDTQRTRELKVQAFNDAGFEVCPVTNGEEALLTLARGENPAAIVSDLNQRRFEGYDLVHVLRGCFRTDLLTSTPQLARLFGPKIEIARRFASGGKYENVPLQHRRTPLVLTSSGPIPNPWPYKKYPAGYRPEPGEWQMDNAEVLHYTKALDLADGFFVVAPTDEQISAITGMDAVIAFVRSRIARI